MVPRLDDVGWIDSLPETCLFFFKQSSHAFIRDIYTDSKGDNQIKAFNQTLPWILSPAHIIFTFLTKTNKQNKSHNSHVAQRALMTVVRKGVVQLKRVHSPKTNKLRNEG